jgi:hypothetical protein
MRKIPFLAATAALLVSATLFAQQAPPPPAAPLTIWVTLKEAHFDWNPVPDAYTYWLLRKPWNQGQPSYYQRVGERIPGGRTHAAIPISAHLHWDDSYTIAACNTAGCTNSFELHFDELKMYWIGYVKASNTSTGDRFGTDVVLSADGSTMAVSAKSEDSDATGVNGNQSSEASNDSGAVYVYRRTGRTWAQEAYLKAGVNQASQSFGAPGAPGLHALGISADGSWLAVAAADQAIAPTGAGAGVVYLFNRTGSTWTLAQTLQAPTPRAAGRFGYSLDLSQDGRTLRVSSFESEGLRTHIFTRPETNWVHSTTLAPFYAGDTCDSVRMSGNGQTLIFACVQPTGGEDRAVMMRLLGGNWVHIDTMPLRGSGYDNRPMAINYHGTRIAINEDRRVGLYRWENGGWYREITIDSPEMVSGVGPGSWGQSLEFDRQGQYLAIGYPLARYDGSGVWSVPPSGGTEPRGGVFIYEQLASAPNWRMRSFVQASNPELDDHFGTSVALSGSGSILAVGAVGEDGGATGIGFTQENNVAADAGAVYLY